MSTLPDVRLRLDLMSLSMAGVDGAVGWDILAHECVEVVIEWLTSVGGYHGGAIRTDVDLERLEVRVSARAAMGSGTVRLGRGLWVRTEAGQKL